MRTARMTIWVMVVVLVAASPSRADLMGYLYEGGGGSNLHLVNFDTGEGTRVGLTGVEYLQALEFSPIDGGLYATDDNGKLYQLDTDSGIADEIMQVYEGDGGYLRLRNLAFAPNGDLFVVSYANTGLFKVDLGTMESDLLGSLSPYGVVTAFAIDSSGRAIGWDETAEWLFEIDLSDGSASSLGNLPGAYTAFDFGPDDVLYAWDASPDGRLYTIDIDNIKLDSYVGQFYPYGPGFTLIPEPTTLLLLGLGAVLLRKRCS